MSKFNDIYNMVTNKQKRKEYNDEMVKNTWQYQKKFGFETSPRQGHEFWNNEADAFKHAFGSADMYFKYGNLGSLGGGIYHEWEQNKNPQGEWNMDSWNNRQGREIAKEIQKEYGDNFMKLSQQQRDDIIAVKVMDRMRNGQLITNPSDRRKYRGAPENISNGIKKIQETKIPFTPTRGVGGVQNNGMPLGFAAPIGEGFVDNVIKELESKEQTSQNQNKQEIKKFINPITGESKIFTREKIGKMSSEEFIKNEDAINAQLKTLGIPSQGDVNRARYSSYSQDSDGHWVTINGHHVLIKE